MDTCSVLRSDLGGKWNPTSRIRNSSSSSNCCADPRHKNTDGDISYKELSEICKWQNHRIFRALLVICVGLAAWVPKGRNQGAQSLPRLKWDLVRDPTQSAMTWWSNFQHTTVTNLSFASFSYSLWAATRSANLRHTEFGLGIVMTEQTDQTKRMNQGERATGTTVTPREASACKKEGGPLDPNLQIAVVVVRSQD